jgi:hypothetical protein
MRGVNGAASFDASKAGEQLWWHDLPNRSSAQPREEIQLQSTDHFFRVSLRPVCRKLCKPLPRDHLKRIARRRLLNLPLNPGSTPFANSRRASSRRSRACFSGISGYAPSASSFSLPSTRYLNRQSFEPLGLIRKVKGAAIRELVGLLARLGVTNRGIGKH